MLFKEILLLKNKGGEIEETFDPIKYNHEHIWDQYTRFVGLRRDQPSILMNYFQMG